MPVLKCPHCARELAAGALVCPHDGTPINSVIARQSLLQEGDTWKTALPTAAAALAPGQRLGDYEVRALLGSGGMGEVYLGEQPMIGKKVAIKVLKGEIAADPGNVQRMLSEARSVNAIRHRGIVDIFNFATLPDGRPYLVMEYLEGTALDVMLRKQGALIPAEVAEFLEEICSALGAAHGQGIVHRDLKPGNVFIVSDGNTRNRYVKLLDFGLAKGEASSAGSKQTRAGMVVGTPDYIAPEQARGGTITPRTDLYSLGVMGFEMLTGGLPFTAESIVELMMMHVQAPAPRVNSKIDFCPPALDALICQLMAKAPEDRPRSADVVRQELARIRRQMRESETVVGDAGAPKIASETVEIPAPEANTPVAIGAGVAAERPARSSAPRPPRASTPRPTAPAQTQTQTQIPPGHPLRWISAAALICVLGAGGYLLLRQPAPPLELPLPPVVELPPPTPTPAPPPEPREPREAVAPAPVPEPPRPAPRPVAIKPIAPKPPPPRPRPEPAVSAPTTRDLQAQMAKLLIRMKEKDKLEAKDLLRADAHWKKKIDDALTPEARIRVRQEMIDAP